METTDTNQRDRTIEILLSRGALTYRELAGEGIGAHTLTRLVQAGVIQRIGHGRYAIAMDADLGTERTALAAEMIAARRSLKPVLCLHTAAMLDSLTTEYRTEAVWVAVPRGGRVLPKTAADVPIRSITVSAGLLDPNGGLGVEEMNVAGRTLLVTDRARTTVDMLRFTRVADWNGNPVVYRQDADEVLRQALEKGVSADEIARIAEAIPRGKWIADLVGEMSRTFGY